MKNKQYQVFILNNGEYREISYETFCKMQNTKFKDAFFICSHGVLMEVSQEFYQEYYRDKRRERYLDELASDKHISYHSLDTNEFNGEDILIDPDEDVADQVMEKIMIEKLRAVLPLLTKDEKDLIQAIYFEEMSERDYAQYTGVYRNAIHKKKIRILAKLKKLLEN